MYKTISGKMSIIQIQSEVPLTITHGSSSTSPSPCDDSTGWHPSEYSEFNDNLSVACANSASDSDSGVEVCLPALIPHVLVPARPFACCCCSDTLTITHGSPPSPRSIVSVAMVAAGV